MKSNSDYKPIIVLDDDPTGSQSVTNVPVLTDWRAASINAEFIKKSPIFFILTNSRALTRTEAEQLNEEIARTISSLIDNFNIVSRGDSTLRGHFFYEVESLAKGLGWNDDYLIVFIPAFIEGNRLTKEDTHYLVDQESWIPIHSTPYAQDKTFGYKNSNLFQYIIEKTHHKTDKTEIGSISIENLEKSDDQFILEKIHSAKKYLIVNSLSYQHIERFISIVKNGHRKILFRSSASFAASFGSVKSNRLLTKGEIYQNDSSSNGGLIVVGSHISTTTSQLNLLLQSGIKRIELDVDKIFNNQTTVEKYLDGISGQIDECLMNKEDIVLYTSRKLFTAEDEIASLKLSVQVSNALVRVIKNLIVKPKFIISKGGITSSEIATKALAIKRAIVLGQVEKGISVWQSDKTSKLPLIPYIVFPGNVGKEDTLLKVYEKLK